MNLLYAIKPYYDCDGITIYNADCRDVLPLLEPNSVDLVLTDPPFFHPAVYGSVMNAKWPRSLGDWGIAEPFFKEVFDLIKTVRSDSGQVYVCCDMEMFPFYYGICYPLYRNIHPLIWYKPTGRIGRGWLHAYEVIMHLSTADTEYAKAFRQDVIGIMPVRTLKRQHPVEKPGDLWDWLMDAMPDGHKVVLDPFMGSASSLVAARRRGYSVIGIDIDEYWCNIAAERLVQEMRGE